MPLDVYGSDAYSPPQIAERIEDVGVKKANLGLLPTFALGILAGGFIGLGAAFYTVVASDPELGFALKRVIGGLVFSLGLILVVIAGAELFTGNNLMVMARVHGKITTRLLIRNFVVVYFANMFGAVGIAALVYWSGHCDAGEIGKTASSIAKAKIEISFGEAFFRGILCNLLVCLAVWLAMAGRGVTDKVFAIAFPITAFVACGFEHCVANMYFIPLGMMLEQGAATLTLAEFSGNLIPVTLGNLVGGAGLVGLIYYLIYRRDTE